MPRPQYFFLISLLCIMIFVVGCNKPDSAIQRRTQFLMGTLIEISIYDKDSDPSAIQNAFNEIQRLEGLMSPHIANSEITKINQSAGVQPTPVSVEVFNVIERALYWAEQSHGALDISVQPIQDLWGFEGASPSLPTEKAIEKTLSKVGYDNIELKNQTVFLTKKGMSLNLGAIAKGYAVDQAMKILKQSNIHNALINAGGDLKTSGTRSDQMMWKIGLQHPRKPEAILANFSLSGKAVATSGDYQRYFEIDGTRYHHVLNPKTGHPATGVMSATVVTQTVMDADALSTALFVLGPEKGIAFINSLENTEGLLVDHNGSLHLSNGMKNLESFSVKNF